MRKREPGPLPLCECGCGRRLRRRWRRVGEPARYFSIACVPHEIRVASGRKGRKKFILERRLARFREHLKRLQTMKTLTGEEMVIVFAQIEDTAWRNGYAACEHKWLGRSRKDRAA